MTRHFPEKQFINNQQNLNISKCYRQQKSKGNIVRNVKLLGPRIVMVNKEVLKIKLHRDSDLKAKESIFNFFEREFS